MFADAAGFADGAQLEALHGGTRALVSSPGTGVDAGASAASGAIGSALRHSSSTAAAASRTSPLGCSSKVGEVQRRVAKCVERRTDTEVTDGESTAVAKGGSTQELAAAIAVR